MRGRWVVGVAIFVHALGFPAMARASGAPRVTATMGQLPVYFIENRGQIEAPVRYYVMGSDASVYFTPGEVTIAETAYGLEGSETALRWAVKLEFLGARPVAPVGRLRTEAIVSYWKGPKSEWKTGLPTYAEVVYPDLWPGIDLVYGGQGSRLKYTFLVRPGADPRQIRIAYHGASEVAANSAGELDVWTPIGGHREDQHYVYQELRGTRVSVATTYEVHADELADTGVVSFALGQYDRRALLTIDPVTTVYCGYVGTGEGRAIAVDGSGNAYIAGSVDSNAFPAMVGPDLLWRGLDDAFVAKVNSAGTALVYAGFIGGASTDLGNGIAVDSSGSAYVAGYTASAESTFPVTVGPDLIFNGDWDAFVAKVNSAGTALEYAGYIGSWSSDYGYGIAVDGSGSAYVTGSTAATLPVTVGPDLTQNGSWDAFVAKVNPGGTALEFAGYIGGASEDHGYGIAVDGSGSAYVTGSTYSLESSFPVTVGPDRTRNGEIDVFVAKVNAAGTALVYAGYLGGTSNDWGAGITVDASGSAYVTGTTQSSNFPASGGSDLRCSTGSFDAFVAKVNAAGTRFEYAGCIGASGLDRGNGIAVDSSGSAYVTGSTYYVNGDPSTQLPVSGGPDLTPNGIEDAFVAKVIPAGTALEYAGYLGGVGQDFGYGIAVDGSGSVYVTGSTASAEGTFPVKVGPDLTFNAGATADNNNVFVAKIESRSDSDDDGELDETDNCPFVANADQADLDGDGIGDACDDDADADGSPGGTDNCPLVVNDDQLDTDDDGLGDACDDDDDGDGGADATDNCPLDVNPLQANTDGAADGGDACDGDDDNDGILDPVDNCPLVANADQANFDGDAEGDVCDLDDDDDGVLDVVDTCPFLSSRELDDTDGDEIGDACDPDDDDDGVLDDADNCPLDVNADQVDADADGLGDPCDLSVVLDADHDGVLDVVDNCLTTVNPSQLDADSDSLGDACDADLDATDVCPTFPDPAQADVDKDGLGDACDDDNGSVQLAGGGCSCRTSPRQGGVPAGAALAWLGGMLVLGRAPRARRPAALLRPSPPMRRARAMARPSGPPGP